MMKTGIFWNFVHIWKGTCVYSNWADDKLVDSGCYYYSDALWDKGREKNLCIFFNS
jgi:hypothetical protein